MILRTALLLVLSLAAMAAERKTENLILVMTDGLRWQEVFQGADPKAMTKANGVGDAAALAKKFPPGQREALMPFVWNVMAKQGQIYGNRTAGSEAYVTNGKNFSYPGYSETLCGFGDPRIDSNDKKINPNRTVLEWLHAKPAYRGRVAVFGAWDAISFIVAGTRGGFVANSGYDPLEMRGERVAFLNQLKSESVMWEAEPLDVFPFRTAMEYLKAEKPRVLFVSLGETDEWAHDGKYPAYLRSAQRVDSYLKELWETVQGMEQYRGKTSLVFTVDHGRGEAPAEWKGHGEKIPDSKYIWMAFLGPDTPALGERKNVPAVTQSQVAATAAALLGEDYRAAEGKAGAVIGDVIGR